MESMERSDRVYEVVISKRPTFAEAQEGIGTRIIFGPYSISASGDAAALVQAGAQAHKAGVELDSSLIAVSYRKFDD